MTEQILCPYFASCGFEDIRACKSKYETCIIYRKKEQVRKIEEDILFKKAFRKKLGGKV